MGYSNWSPGQILRAGVLSPMHVAGYVAIAAVAVEPLMKLGFPYSQSPWSLPPWQAFGALGVMLVLFVFQGILGERGGSVPSRRAVALSQLVAALVTCYGFRGYLQPALLCIVTAQLVVLYPLRAVVALMLLAQAVLAVIYLQVMPLHAATTLLVAYLSFYMFGGVMAVQVQHAEEARDATLRINNELMATRQLLEEGARAEERLRLSRELHDIAGHKLTALKLQLALHGRRAAADVRAGLDHCERLAEELLSDIRSVVSALRQHEGVDLHRALQALDPHLPWPRVIFELGPETRVADIQRAEALLHCAQEGLTNALRHSAAATVRVGLARDAHGVRLCVSDDGRGDPAKLREGNGLRGLRERLSAVGGRLEIERAQPAGLVLKAVVPDPQPLAVDFGNSRSIPLAEIPARAAGRAVRRC